MNLRASANHIPPKPGLFHGNDAINHWIQGIAHFWTNSQWQQAGFDMASLGLQQTLGLLLDENCQISRPYRISNRLIWSPGQFLSFLSSRLFGFVTMITFSLKDDPCQRSMV